EWALDAAPYDNKLKAMRQYCYGQLAFRQRRYADAIQAYKEAIQFDPDWALPYNSIGVAYARQKRWTKVLEWCSRAKRRDTDWAFPYLNMGWAFYNLKRYDEAEQEYKMGAQLAPTRPTVYCHLNCIHEKKGRLFDSLEMAEKAMEVAQQNPDRWQTQIKDLQKRIERLKRKVGLYDIEVTDE
ncbi:MAG: tetratricopeptide repeat protein, partial [Candidatus Caldarchaeum sp.]